MCLFVAELAWFGGFWVLVCGGLHGVLGFWGLVLCLWFGVCWLVFISGVCDFRLWVVGNWWFCMGRFGVLVWDGVLWCFFWWFDVVLVYVAFRLRASRLARLSCDLRGLMCW